MKESFRWYGPKDPVPLSAIRQAGATTIVSALHDVPNGEVWSIDAIKSHQKLIANAGLKWGVVESVPIHEEIKQRTGNFKVYIENYKATLENLAHCEILTVCYNFMPVLDWTRTHLYKPLEDGSTALSYEIDALRAFDLFVVKRAKAAQDYTEQEIQDAKAYFEALTPLQIESLTKSIIAGLPGAEEGYTMQQFNEQIEAYANLNEETLRSHLIQFLAALMPTAEAVGVNMCIHPDDPPHSLFGIPRVVSTATDIEALFSAVPSLNNGLTFCTGSFGVRPDNDLLEMFTQHAERIHFLHFRSTKRDDKGNFYEANHLEGDVDMFAMVKAALLEERRRKEAGRSDWEIPMRPDHGHQMLDDLEKHTNPGYSAIGRLKGLAELRGLAMGIIRSGF
ncbi:mannonate dehydratase [Flavobacteriaceae bacterium]|nr:mannonate dehydratase [Flavobacteriaceae bacterium]MDB2341061.1 mannonate dehydratase [Flavobacteriaceae bacterium]